MDDSYNQHWRINSLQIVENSLSSIQMHSDFWKERTYKTDHVKI